MTDNIDTQTCGPEHEESVFRFRRFSVINRRSAMKVNTDGVLLGAAMTLEGNERQLLDIGTGTGTIALMAAQRLSELRTEENLPDKFVVTGIDIDPDSAAEAEENFRRSCWKDRLTAIHASLNDFSASCDADTRFDMIFSNPPYYGGDLKAPDPRRCNARHAGSLSWTDIIGFAAEYLSENGHLSLILPSDQKNDLNRHAASCGLYMFRLVYIRTVPRKNPKRILAEFSRKLTRTPQEETISIQEAGTWSENYRSLLSDFLINL